MHISAAEVLNIRIKTLCEQSNGVRPGLNWPAHISAAVNEAIARANAEGFDTDEARLEAIGRMQEDVIAAWANPGLAFGERPKPAKKEKAKAKE